MKIKQIGQKLNAFKNYIGGKIYSGAKAVGQKIYDNRYKILIGAGLLAGGLLANSYGANINPETLVQTAGAGASIAPLASQPKLSDTLRAQGKFRPPLQPSIAGLFPPKSLQQAEARYGGNLLNPTGESASDAMAFLRQRQRQPASDMYGLD